MPVQSSVLVTQRKLELKRWLYVSFPHFQLNIIVINYFHADISKTSLKVYFKKKKKIESCKHSAIKILKYLIKTTL